MNHYRKPMNFSFEEMENTKKTFDNIINSMKRISMSQSDEKIDSDEEFINLISKLDEKFDFSMDDDLNTPMALSTIFDQIRETNKYIDNHGKSFGIKVSYNSLKKKLVDVIGINIENEIKNNIDDLAKDLINLLIELRKDARENKNFYLSDKIRDELKKLGIEIKDNKDGSTTISY